MPAGRRIRRTVCATGLLALTSAGCGPTVTAPNVVGMRLDDAPRLAQIIGADGGLLERPVKALTACAVSARSTSWGPTLGRHGRALPGLLMVHDLSG
jgi:hypothetical protein